MNSNLNFSGKRILFIGAHPDDIELGCGALIAHITGHCTLRCVTLSDNQKNPALTEIPREHVKSMQVLGVKKEDITIKEFETRRFPQFRQEILEYLIELNQDFNPNVVFVHTQADLHQDHTTATEETLRAFRGTSVFGYDVIRSSYGFFPTFFVEVDASDVDRKLRALAEYHTYVDKYYFHPEVTRATLIRHGALAGKQYAEGFQILRIIASFNS
jgi:LmbE family N-acetylglucosaminyl deacetylase